VTNARFAALHGLPVAPYTSRRRPFHSAKPRARHERQWCWPQQRRASVCGSAAALRSVFVPAVSPPALHHAALISAVFIRLLSALLVAPRNFAPRNDSCHCIAFAPPPASAKSRLGAFRSEPDCSPTSRRREQSRSFKHETQKHEHDRKLQLNASTDRTTSSNRLNSHRNRRNGKLFPCGNVPHPKPCNCARRRNRPLIIGERTSPNIRISILNVNVWWF
jgi:hypothetical protein